MSCGRTHACAEPVDRADEAHHELVGRLLVQLARRPDLLDPAVVHDHDPVGDVHRLFLVVGHEHGRDVGLVVQPAQPRAQLLAHPRVERTERLVEQQHLRLDGERAGERHALALAARQLCRIAVRELVDLDQPEQLAHLALDLVLGTLADRQPEGDVVEDGHVLERRVVLEHEADAALLGRSRGHVPVAEPDRCRRRASRARR